MKKHQWENRILLIISSQEKDPKCQAQMEEFKKEMPGLLDRKLIVYRVLPHRYKVMASKSDQEKEKWISSPQIFSEYGEPDEKFRVILIGLDGGVKLEKSELLTASELFRTIDAMPMRRAEMRNRKQ